MRHILYADYLCASGIQHLEHVLLSPYPSRWHLPRRNTPPSLKLFLYRELELNGSLTNNSSDEHSNLSTYHESIVVMNRIPVFLYAAIYFFKCSLTGLHTLA